MRWNLPIWEWVENSTFLEPFPEFSYKLYLSWEWQSGHLTFPSESTLQSWRLGWRCHSLRRAIPQSSHSIDPFSLSLLDKLLFSTLFSSSLTSSVTGLPSNQKWKRDFYLVNTNYLLKIKPLEPNFIFKICHYYLKVGGCHNYDSFVINVYVIIR